MILLTDPSEVVADQTVLKAESARPIIDLPHTALLLFGVQWCPLVLNLHHLLFPVPKYLLTLNPLAPVYLQLVRTSKEHLVLQEVSFEAEH